MGTWNMEHPLDRAALVSLAELEMRLVCWRHSLRGSCNLPPSERNSFWYSMRTRAVSLGSSCGSVDDDVGGGVR